MPFLSFLTWLGLVAVAWLFRVSYIGWLGPWLLAIVIVVPLGILLLSLPSMLRLGITLRAPSVVVRGQESTYAVEFTNPALFPVHAVTLHLELRNRFTGDIHKESYIFRNVESSRSELPLSTALCGTVSIRLVSFDMKDLMGMFTLRRRLRSKCECSVLPSAVGPDEPPDFEAALSSSDVLKPKYGGGYAEDHDLRNYRPGDPPNSIHWKLSSKTDDLIVREALVPENSTVYVVLERVGTDDRGLELLRWLSQALLAMDEKHTLVADRLYEIESDEELSRALSSVLSAPMREPCGFDMKSVRCIFTVSAGEVRVQ
ncbi:MAG: DUF58 domain-containing protein [Oscillospiraceae bacterium]|nr:DUF58 domain-containing protein [Oscillospiraceae bacterium]